VLGRLGLLDRFEAWRAVTEWEDIVGESLARHARAVRVERDVLVVEASHPAVSHDISHRKRELLALLERRLGSARIRDVRLVLHRTEERR
jgi:predicted nucleic acid-binding Zn ribbon protein